MGMGLGSVELGWDPESDMEPRLDRSGSELRVCFFLECALAEVQWNPE